LQCPDKGAAEDGSEAWGDSLQPITAPVERVPKAVVPVLPPVRHHLNALFDTAAVLEHSSCLLYIIQVAMLGTLLMQYLQSEMATKAGKAHTHIKVGVQNASKGENFNNYNVQYLRHLTHVNQSYDVCRSCEQGYHRCTLCLW